MAVRFMDDPDRRPVFRTSEATLPRRYSPRPSRKVRRDTDVPMRIGGADTQVRRARLRQLESRGSGPLSVARPAYFDPLVVVAVVVWGECDEGGGDVGRVRHRLAPFASDQGGDLRREFGGDPRRERVAVVRP